MGNEGAIKSECILILKEIEHSVCGRLQLKLVWIIFFCQTLFFSSFVALLISLTFEFSFLNLELFGKLPISLAILCSCYDTKTDNLTFTKVDKFLPDKIYYHGCLKSFLQITKWKGPEVCFIL